MSGMRIRTSCLHVVVQNKRHGKEGIGVSTSMKDNFIRNEGGVTSAPHQTVFKNRIGHIKSPQGLKDTDELSRMSSLK